MKKVLLLFLAICVVSFVSCKKKSTEDKIFLDEAEKAGYDVSQIKNLQVKDVTDFKIVSYTNSGYSFGTEPIVSVHGDSSSTVDNGEVGFDVTTESTSATVKIWINGLPIMTEKKSGEVYFQGVITLGSGANYIAAIVYDGSTATGRSSILKINCNEAQSLYRFQMVWDQTCDIDMHLQQITTDPSPFHIYYGNKILNDSTYHIELDVDNTHAYGPENIRVFSAPVGTSFRCYVHYFSGSPTTTVVVQVFKGSHVEGTYQQTLTYGGSDWIVGTYNIVAARDGGITMERSAVNDESEIDKSTWVKKIK